VELVQVRHRQRLTLVLLETLFPGWSEAGCSARARQSSLDGSSSHLLVAPFALSDVRL